MCRVSAQRRGGEVVVEVRDTGPGIPADQQGRIFEEYVQLANPARQRRHGVGLGLAIVKRIDTLLQLQLTLESEVDAGSTFRFVVPASDETPAPALRRSGGVIELQHEPVAYGCSTTIRRSSRAFRSSSPRGARRWKCSRTPKSCSANCARPRICRAGSSPTTCSAPRCPAWRRRRSCRAASASAASAWSPATRSRRACHELRASGFPVIVKPARGEELIAILAEEATD